MTPTITGVSLCLTALGKYLLLSFIKESVIGRKSETFCLKNSLVLESIEGQQTIFIFNTLIEMSKAENTSLFVCFVDLKKAFDSVNHNLLWEKLKSHGFSYQMLKVLQSMYSKATSCVRISASFIPMQERN